MKPTETELEIARRVIRQEGEALLATADAIGEGFAAVYRLVRECEGKVVVTGIGKSGHVCRKIAATLASTGKPAFFLHPAEGVHGDLGMITGQDVALAISNSGETAELLAILPTLRRLKVPIASITAGKDTSLGRVSDAVIETGRLDEACSLSLAPTTSTTVALALGDALAVALMEGREFTKDDFALFHPSGSLGRKLLLTVQDLMHGGDALPTVPDSATMKDAIVAMTAGRLGITAVLDADGKLVGCVTDGDLRRGLEKHADLLTVPVTDAMTPSPRRIARHRLAMAALNEMETHSITAIFVVDAGDPDRPVGVIHLHDILKSGLA